jgi:uncharacterized protein YukE
MSIPANYDSSSISVDPWVLHSSASAIHDAVFGINDDMTAITNKLNELRLSWVGDSSERSQKFQHDWNDIWQRLYGTKEHPEHGILNRFASGLAAAAVGYSRGERAVSDSFARLEAALEGMNVKSWNLPRGTDIEDELSKHPVPKPTTPDYTKHAPPEHKAVDQVSGSEGQIHSTSVDQTF